MHTLTESMHQKQKLLVKQMSKVIWERAASLTYSHLVVVENELVHYGCWTGENGQCSNQEDVRMGPKMSCPPKKCPFRWKIVVFLAIQGSLGPCAPVLNLACS